MLKIFIALSTYNRKKITSLCLENLKNIIDNDGSALLSIYDDASTTYDEKLLKKYSENVLRFIEKYNFKFKFDIIFLDPPYKDKEFLSIFDNLKKKNILKKEHLIILHRERKTTELPLKLLNVLESRIYGRSEIFFLKLLRD